MRALIGVFSAWNAYFSDESLLRRKQEAAGLVKRDGRGIGLGAGSWGEDDEHSLRDLFGPPRSPANGA